MRAKGTGQRVTLGVGTLGVVSLLSAGALALSGYSVSVKAPSSVSKGQTFTIKASGSAAHSAHLYVYLDPKKCATTGSKEGQQDTTYKTGHSYFVQKGEGGTIKSTWYYAAVKGSFTGSPKAHAGTHAGQQYACAYLVSPDKFGNYSITAHRASARYTIK